MKGVFITGATGNIGSRLLKEYLLGAGHTVYLLVRGRTQEHAEERVKEVLGFWDLSFEQYRGRLVVLRGDVEQPDLGLAPDVCDQLREKIHLFIHSASNIRLDLSAEEARRTILGGTKNAYELSRRFSNIERFGFVSTLEVIGDRSGQVKEEFLDNHRVNFLNTYELAKFEAEEYLRQRSEECAAITVFRPGMVVGESRTGKALEFQSFYLLAEKMLLNPDYPVMPKGPPVNTIPVDILAEGIARLMEYPGARGQVYHFCQGADDRTEFTDFIEQLQPVAEALLKRPVRQPKYVSPVFHRALLRLLRKLTWGRAGRYIRTQLLFLDYSFVSWNVDNSKARETLKGMGMHWPRFADYLPQLMGYYCAHCGGKRWPF